MSHGKLKIKDRKFRQGYAALTAILLVIFSSLTIIGGLTFFSFQEVAVNRVATKAMDARAVAESGTEDALYRVVSGKQIAASETLGAGKGTTTISVTTLGTTRTIRSAARRDDVGQNIEVGLQTSSTGVGFNFAVQVGDGGITMANGAQVNGDLYATGNVSGGTITGAATVAGGLTDNPQSQWAVNNSDQFFATSTASRDIAQSFTAPAAGLLNRVSVYLAKVGSPASNLTLRIVTDSAGKPDRNGEIANAVIAPSQVGTSAAWIDVPFVSPPTLTNGTKYWIVLDYGSNSTANYWNWRKDATDGYAGNTGRYANDWTSASAVWINTGGDLAFRAWIGGINTKISNATVGATGHANMFVSDTIGGSACPNANCIVDNPPYQAMPITDAMIQQWKDEAVAGGVCAAPLCDASGNLTVASGASKTIGPLKIAGDLNLSNNAHLTLSGTVWVVGDVNLSNGCTVALAGAYGNKSGLLIDDGVVDTSNNCAFSGSGIPGSYMMVLDDKNDHAGTVMDISNNNTGAIFYAASGRVHINNNAGAKEITAYGIDLDNNATITYETGLATLSFTSSPSGGYQVRYWKQAQ